jgi:hypothetical protein
MALLSTRTAPLKELSAVQLEYERNGEGNTFPCSVIIKLGERCSLGDRAILDRIGYQLEPPCQNIRSIVIKAVNNDSSPENAKSVLGHVATMLESAAQSEKKWEKIRIEFSPTSSICMTHAWPYLLEVIEMCKVRHLQIDHVSDDDFGEFTDAVIPDCLFSRLQSIVKCEYMGLTSLTIQLLVVEFQASHLQLLSAGLQSSSARIESLCIFRPDIGDQATNNILVADAPKWTSVRRLQLPCWSLSDDDSKKLALGIANRGMESNLVDLDLVCNELGQRGLDAIAKVVSQTPLQLLNISSQKGPFNLDAMSNALATSNVTLSMLDIGFNKIPLQSMVTFAQVLQKNRSLQHLEMPYLDLNEDGGAYKFGKDVLQLAGYSKIYHALGNSLRHNKSLLSLKLGYVDDNCLSAVADGLRRNPSLTTVTFACEPATLKEAGIKSLVQCLKCPECALKNVDLYPYDLSRDSRFNDIVLLCDLRHVVHRMSMLTTLVGDMSADPPIRGTSSIPAGLWPLVIEKMAAGVDKRKQHFAPLSDDSRKSNVTYHMLRKYICPLFEPSKKRVDLPGQLRMSSYGQEVHSRLGQPPGKSVDPQGQVCITTLDQEVHPRVGLPARQSVDPPAQEWKAPLDQGSRSWDGPSIKQKKSQRKLKQDASPLKGDISSSGGLAFTITSGDIESATGQGWMARPVKGWRPWGGLSMQQQNSLLQEQGSLPRDEDRCWFWWH